MATTGESKRRVVNDEELERVREEKWEAARRERTQRVHVESAEDAEIVWHPKRNSLEDKLSYHGDAPPKDAAGIRAWAKRLLDNPVEMADWKFRKRRFRGTSQHQRDVISAKTLREPVLNALPESVSRGLLYKERETKDRIPKDRLYDTIVVKPVTSAAAIAGRSSTFWGERRWTVYRAKYTRGYVLVTDTNAESKLFPTYGELKSAIIKSGWEIVR